jgi:hypothetical protein
MEYRLCKYSNNYLPALTSLIDKTFSIENTNKLGLIKWKYFNLPENEKAVCYIAFDNLKHAVGCYINIPFTTIRVGKKYKSFDCTDMCTDVNHRGKGLISQLSDCVYKEICSKHYDFSLGFSNDEGVKVDKYAKNYGYYIVGKFVRYFKLVLFRKQVTYQLIKVKQFSEGFKSANSRYFKVFKTVNYLQWRYVLKPNASYEIYKISADNKFIGYVVLRILKNRCYIYDIISKDDDKEIMTNILRAIENKALDNNVRLIIYNVLDNSYWCSLFNKYKYFKKENNKVNYYLTVKIHNHRIRKVLLLDKNNWLLMNGDIL